MISTEQLLHQIRQRRGDEPPLPEDPAFGCPPPAIYLSGLLAERGMEKREVIRLLGLDRTYGYQLFNGTRRPTRTVLIRLAALLGLDLAGTNRLLAVCRRQPLYPRVREDAALIWAIERHMPLEQLDALLETLYA